jgi:DNA (cytosine-5)-methyltransferase 1
MNHGSLFSGIGGFDLASEWMGWDNKFHCEWEDFPRKILKYYWPKSESYGDIKKTDFTIWRDRIDILTGGFPCQPYSSAGNRLGKEDDRHLWPEMLRAIQEIKPRWVIGENVRGLVNWNEGLVFEEVHSELETEGYEVESFLLPACGVGAPHRRDRIWFVAYSDGAIKRDRQGENTQKEREVRRDEKSDVSRKLSSDGNASDSIVKRLQRKNKTRKENIDDWQNSKIWRNFTGYGIKNNWEQFPTKSPVCSGDDGISSKLDNITFPKWRRESIKGYGNAIVPQVVFQIFKAIEEFDKNVSMNCKNS